MHVCMKKTFVNKKETETALKSITWHGEHIGHKSYKRGRNFCAQLRSFSLSLSLQNEFNLILDSR